MPRIDERRQSASASARGAEDMAFWRGYETTSAADHTPAPLDLHSVGAACEWGPGQRGSCVLHQFRRFERFAGKQLYRPVHCVSREIGKRFGRLQQRRRRRRRPLVGNFTPTGVPDSKCGSTAPFPTTNMTGVLMHYPKVTVISLRPTCDSVRTPGCTASQIETDLRIVTDFARANGVKIFVQTPQPCECAPKTSLTATVRKVYSWVKANYPNNYIDMTTDFSLPDGTINHEIFRELPTTTTKPATRSHFSA